MKRYNISKYIIIIIFALLTSTSVAEESGDIYIGAIFGLPNFLNEYKLYNPPSLDKLHNIQVTNIGFGLMVESSIYQGESLSHSYIWRFAHIKGWMSENKRADYTEKVLIKDINNPTHDVIYNLSIGADTYFNYSFFNFDLLYKFAINTKIPFGFLIGASTLKTKRIDIYERYGVLNPELPENIKRVNYSIIRLDKDDCNENIWGISTNVFADYPITENLKLGAELGYTYYFRDITKSYKWDISSINYYVTLGYKVNQLFKIK